MSLIYSYIIINLDHVQLRRASELPRGVDPNEIIERVGKFPPQPDHNSNPCPGKHYFLVLKFICGAKQFDTFCEKKCKS
jgi:hypothetical protein